MRWKCLKTIGNHPFLSDPDPAVLRQQIGVSVSHTRITSPSVVKETPKEPTLIDYTCREEAAYVSLKKEKRLCDEISLTLKVKVFPTFLIKAPGASHAISTQAK